MYLLVFFANSTMEFYFGLLLANPNELHVVHCAGNGDKATLISDGEYGTQELSRLEAACTTVFSEPMYQIWQNR